MERDARDAGVGDDVGAGEIAAARDYDASQGVAETQWRLLSPGL